MIGLGITGLDLSSNQRYFDIQLIGLEFKYGSFVKQTIQTLQPCQY